MCKTAKKLIQILTIGSNLQKCESNRTEVSQTSGLMFMRDSRYSIEGHTMIQN